MIISFDDASYGWIIPSFSKIMMDQLPFME
jgi:hypothetical protein